MARRCTLRAWEHSTAGRTAVYVELEQEVTMTSTFSLGKKNGERKICA